MQDFSDDNYGLDDSDRELISSLGDNQTAQGQIAATDNDLASDLLPDQPQQPVFEGPQLDQSQPLPGGVLDDIAATPSPVPEEPKPVAATSEETIRKQGGLEKQQAEVQTQVAEQQAEAARQHNMDMRLAYADYLERRQAAEQNLDRRIKELDAAKFEDPRSKDPHKNRIAVIFGALGAGLAGGSNTGLEAVQKKWHDDAERQKANIGLLSDKVAMARTGIPDADEARRQLNEASNAQLISNYNTAIKQGELQLKRLGVPAAEIATDQRLQQLQAGKGAAVAKAPEEQDEHGLAQARIRLMNAQAGKAARRGTGTSDKEAKKAAAKADEDANKDVERYEARTEGRTINVKGQIKTVHEIQALRRQLDAAVASGDPSRMKAATVAISEKAGSVLSGGKTTQFQGKIIDSPKTFQDELQEKIGHWTNQPQVGKAYLQSLRDLLNTVEGSHLEDVDLALKQDKGRLLGPGGVGRTQSAKANAMNLIQSRYGEVQNPDGTPRYNLEEQQQEKKAVTGVDPEKTAEAKRIMADPGSYSPKARAAAAKYLKALLN